MKPTWMLAAAFLTNATLIPTLAEARTEIQNKGSDTLVNVAQAWAEAYQKVEPEVAVAVSGGGSGTGIAALINGTVDIANASRKMKEKEIDWPEKRGNTPVEHIVGFDALAVYSSTQDNPAEYPQHSPAGGNLRAWWQIHQVDRPGHRGARLQGSANRRGQPPEQLRHLCLFPRSRARQGTGSTAWAPSTCTAPRTSSTWLKKPPVPSVTAAWRMRPTTSRWPASPARTAGLV